MNTLTRTMFETSRLLEFFTEKELTMQMGHGRDYWPMAILKELIDNSLDACEVAGIPPEITVCLGDDWLSVADNGGGLSEKTIRKALDYTVRVSDKAYYISPTRGQLGNALKCVFAAPFVVSGEHGRVTIETNGKCYSVDVSLNRIAQEPVINLTVDDCPTRDGVKITVFWPESTGLLGTKNTLVFYNRKTYKDLIGGYAMFNPHARFVVDEQPVDATDTGWNKWKPNNPTSPHWYNVERLRGLIAAYLTAEMDGSATKTVREFISEFRGLSSTIRQKKVSEGADVHGLLLADLVHDGDVDTAPVERLLSAMQENSKAVQADLLGVIGQEHIKARMVDYYNVEPDSVRYKKIARIDNETNLPHLIEVAFGVYNEEHEEQAATFITGLNWSPTLGIPAREIQHTLGEMRVDRHDPVCVVIHIARPLFEFADRGKGVLNV